MLFAHDAEERRCVVLGASHSCFGLRVPITLSAPGRIETFRLKGQRAEKAVLQSAIVSALWC